jgi:hypothetical protein
MRRNRVWPPALALALVAGAALFAQQSMAATETEDQPLVKVSQDGYAAMRAVRDARLAIFDGRPDAAKTFVADAGTALTDAEKEAPNYSVKTEVFLGDKATTDERSGKVDWIPIDANLALVDNFVMTPEKAEHIQKANEHFKAGDTTKAVEELKQGEVDVNYVQFLMPLEATKRHVDQASDLLADDKYYEANLALKAAEDGMVINSTAMVAPPPPTQ